MHLLKYNNTRRKLPVFNYSLNQKFYILPYAVRNLLFSIGNDGYELIGFLFVCEKRPFNFVKSYEVSHSFSQI